MADENILRPLERAAALGDAEAIERLARAQRSYDIDYFSTLDDLLLSTSGQNIGYIRREFP